MALSSVSVVLNSLRLKTVKPNWADTYTFPRSGRTASCIALTEGELMDLPEVTHAQSSLKTHTVDVTGEFWRTYP